MIHPNIDIIFDTKHIGLLIVCAIALFSSILMLLFYIFCKPMRAHPGQLLLLTSAFEASTFYFLLLEILMPFNNYDLEAAIIRTTAFSLPFSMHWDSEEICIVHEMMLRLSITGIFGYCLIVALDLLFIIHNPFYSPTKRLKSYHLYFTFALLTPLLVIIGLRANIICYNKAESQGSELEIYTKILEVMQVGFGTTIVLAIVVSLFVSLKRVGFGWFAKKEKQVVFLKKHVYYVILFFCAFAVQLSFQYVQLASKFTDYISPHTIYQWKIANTYAYFVPGIFLLPLRMLEPYMFQVFKVAFRGIFLKEKSKIEANRESEALVIDIFTMKYKQHRKIEETSSYFSVLHTSLNAQLVDTLLNGLFSIYTVKSKVGMKTPSGLTQGLKESIDEGYIYEMARGGINASIMSLEEMEINERKDILSNTPKRQIKEQITLYGSEILDELITMDNISPDDIVEGLDPVLNARSIFKASLGEGKSGSFFFFSTNSRFIIKTLTKQDAKTFLTILPNYYTHLNNNKDSLLSRIYCLFSVKLTGIVRLYGILMQNTLPICSGMELECVFDLKGSVIHRYKRLIHEDIIHKRTILDINFLKLDHELNLVDIKDSDKCKISSQIMRDSSFLGEQKCLDYSILLGVYKCSSPMKDREELGDNIMWGEQKRNGWVSKSGKRAYFFSIIDYLQSYTIKKQIEHFLKAKILYPGQSDKVTVIPPYQYYIRFYKFISRRVIKE